MESCPLFFMSKNFTKGESMGLKERLSNHIKSKGLKKTFVAEKIGITPQKLSYYLHGKLLLIEDIDDKVKAYLESEGA